MARYKASGCAIIDEEHGWPPLLKDRSASKETLEFVAAALNTRAEAEHLAKVEVAAFKQRAILELCYACKLGWPTFVEWAAVGQENFAWSQAPVSKNLAHYVDDKPKDATEADKHLYHKRPGDEYSRICCHAQSVIDMPADDSALRDTCPVDTSHDTVL